MHHKNFKEEIINISHAFFLFNYTKTCTISRKRDCNIPRGTTTFPPPPGYPALGQLLPPHCAHNLDGIICMRKPTVVRLQTGSKWTTDPLSLPPPNPAVACEISSVNHSILVFFWAQHIIMSSRIFCNWYVVYGLMMLFRLCFLSATLNAKFFWNFHQFYSLSISRSPSQNELLLKTTYYTLCTQYLL